MGCHRQMLELAAAAAVAAFHHWPERNRFAVGVAAVAAADNLAVADLELAVRQQYQ